MNIMVKKMKMIRVVVMLLLALPVLLSVFGGGKFVASMLASLFDISVDGMTDSFRSHACIELVGASFASVAFFILARYAADRVVRRALWLLVLSELYMFYYWLAAFLSPSKNSVEAELLGNSLLVLVVLVCCYAWSLLWRSNSLSRRERTWMQFLFMPYILSFVAFFAPMWQRFVPENYSVYMMPENNPVYIAVAIVMNVLRVVALWFFVKSSLFVPGPEKHECVYCDTSALNRCVLGVLISAFFVISGLAFVYRNVHLFSKL